MSSLNVWPYVLAHLLAGLLASLTAMVVWKRRDSPGAIAFLVVLLACSWTCFWRAVSLVVPLEFRFPLAPVWYAGMMAAPMSFLVFALQYVRHERRWPVSRLLALAVIPTLTWLEFSTNWQHLFWTRLYLDVTADFPLYGMDYGPAAIAAVVLNEGAASIGLGVLLWVGVTNRGLYRRQVVALSAGVTLPLAAYVSYGQGHSPLHDLQVTATSLTLGSVLIGWAVFGERLLDIVPIAHKMVIQSISDAVLVLDWQDRVLYANDAAQLLARPQHILPGRPVSDVLPQLSSVIAEVTRGQGSREFSWGLGSRQRSFDVLVSPLRSDGNERGRTVVLRDVSDRYMVDRLQRSRQQIIAAEEHARREIAEMLHGTVQSKLLAIAFSLRDYQDRWHTSEDEAAELTSIRDALEGISEHEVRKASHLLHPSIIRFGLTPAIQDLADSFSAAFRVRVVADPELLARDTIGGPSLDAGLRLVTYRVVEEALNNAAKHANAKHVEITLGLDGEQLRVTVSDDGIGFDPSRVRPGLGIESVIGRIDHCHGQWRIESQPGAGTTIEVTLPLSPLAASDPGSVPVQPKVIGAYLEDAASKSRVKAWPVAELGPLRPSRGTGTRRSR